MMLEPAWYVLQVLTGKEQDVAEAIRAAGLPVMAPVKIVPEHRHDKWRDVRRTVFPGYVFLRCCMTTRMYYYLKGQQHALRLLGSVGNPEPVPDDQMEVVRIFDNNGQDFGVSMGVKAKSKTTITDGPLVGLSTYITSIDQRQRRAVVEVEILGTKHRIHAGVDIEKA